MVLKLPSGYRISVSPFFFWESPSASFLRIRSGSTFYPLHVTTRLCLEFLIEAFQARVGMYRTVLDVGCGSGILALAAAGMGVSAAVGLDVDFRAVAVSRENARSNNLQATTHWFKGTTAALRSRFDCVLANLPLTVILELLDELPALVDRDGILILSGFHDTDWRALEEEFTRRGLQTLGLRSGDQSFYGVPPSGSFTWMAALMRRRLCEEESNAKE